MRSTAVVLLGTLILAGCGGPEPAPEVADANGDTVKAIVEGVKADYGPFDVLAAGYTSRSPIDRAEVGVEVVCGGCDAATVADQVMRGLWKSDVAPIDEILVMVRDRTSERDARLFFSLPAQEDDLVEKYGERPVKSSKTLGQD